MALSPMMQQYMEIKDQNKDCILFFRLGDFYEMFFDDAILVSKELELTLTGKNCGLEERAPMCGVPFHSADSYIEKLIEKGYKVAICEQTEDPASSKGLVKREVIQIVTPGTVTSTNILSEKENNYLAGVYIEGACCGFAYCDISTGELNVTQISPDNMESDLINELVRINVREILINTASENYIDMSLLENTCEAYINLYQDEDYPARSAKTAITRQFESISLTSLGLEDQKQAERALGVLLLYLGDTQKQSLSHLMRPGVYKIGSHMALDRATIRNLEITETLFEKNVKGSLLGVLDRTHTAMGSRRMKQWLREPLNDAVRINERLDAVAALTEDPLTANNIRENLKGIYDFERLSGRIATGNANGKDMLALGNSIFVLPEIKLDLEGMPSPLLCELEKNIDPLKEIHERIEAAIVDDPPFTIKEGGVIKAGYSEELDELNDSIKDARTWIAELESKEKERTGITNLKVGYNKVFGYYLEITKSWYDHIPENYIRKQTLANAERFITPELKEMESLVMNAEAKINAMEYDLFCELREYIKGAIPRLQQTSRAVSALDVLSSFAEVSGKMNYVRPEVDEGEQIVIENGRHPVIEQTVEDGVFVANDAYLDRNDSSMLLITGPNMSGKSTYMRQTALIVLMAQSGCFVPADRAVIGVCDRIFTRIGASDNLAGGESTFYVEMSELAYILNSATSRSLVILDEIGRGTSTYDGLSIAWAVCEYLCQPDKKIRTLFASHYHELTDLENRLQGFRNLNVDVAEVDGEVIFLHKIVEGSASRSYGIHVARIAGVPEELLENADKKLKQLEETSAEINDPDGHQLKFIL